MLASDSGEIDRARFRLNLGVTRGLENRDTGGKRDFVRQNQRAAPFLRGGRRRWDPLHLWLLWNVQEPEAARGPAALWQEVSPLLGAEWQGSGNTTNARLLHPPWGINRSLSISPFSLALNELKIKREKAPQGFHERSRPRWCSGRSSGPEEPHVRAGATLGNGVCAWVRRERKPNEGEHNADHPINEGGEAPGAPKVNEEF